MSVYVRSRILIYHKRKLQIIFKADQFKHKHVKKYGGKFQNKDKKWTELRAAPGEQKRRFNKRDSACHLKKL